MKLTIHQDLDIPETEIIINCAHMDLRIQRLIALIRQHSFSITAYQEEKEFQLPLEQIYFIDSVDGKTFLYLEKEVYSCRNTLAVLEEKLVHTSFIRISKNCIINTNFLKSVRPMYNHRLEALLENGETLVVTRNYIEALKNKLKGENL
ncbi:MAG: LytTR family transcriptional regulator [Lachnospiraceae bacterium]|nr:LytTR family transcriptional regulator [Lachnospiraceae bacterium]